MLAQSIDDSSIRRIAFILLTLAIIIVGLVYGRPFLIPIVIAILITILVGAGADRLKRVGLPEPLATLSALIILVCGIAVVFNVLASQADAVTLAWPRYIERLNIMADQLLRWAGPQIAGKVTEALANLDLMRQIPGVVGSAGGFLVNLVLVTIYVGFLLAERGRLSGKIDLFFNNTEHAGEMQRAAADIGDSIRRYLLIKTIMSLLTSATSYAVLKTIGVDFAETWALIIFLLNYIPSIGAIIGVGVSGTAGAHPIRYVLAVPPHCGSSGGDAAHHRQYPGTQPDGQDAESQPVRRHRLAGVLGDDMGDRRGVSQRPVNHRPDYRVQPHSVAQMGRHSAFGGWPDHAGHPNAEGKRGRAGGKPLRGATAGIRRQTINHAEHCWAPIPLVWRIFCSS